MVILGAAVSLGESINPYLRAYISNSRALLIAFADNIHPEEYTYKSDPCVSICSPNYSMSYMNRKA